MQGEALFDNIGEALLLIVSLASWSTLQSYCQAVPDLSCVPAGSCVI